ncbi:MAG: hypothetical protein AAGL10_04245 [Pseudomonadota bacterium]
MKLGLWLASIMLAVGPMPLLAQSDVAAEQSGEVHALAEKPPLIATADFASRSAYWSAQLSPDGRAMSVLHRINRVLTMTVLDPNSGKKVNSISFADGTSVDWTRWLTNDRMLVKTSAIVGGNGFWYRTTRFLLVYPKQGSFHFLVENPRGLNGGDLVHVEENGEFASRIGVMAAFGNRQSFDMSSKKAERLQRSFRQKRKFNIGLQMMPAQFDLGWGGAADVCKYSIGIAMLKSFVALLG